jgi:hypothetical protein
LKPIGTELKINQRHSLTGEFVNVSTEVLKVELLLGGLDKIQEKTETYKLKNYQKKYTVQNELSL